MLNNTAEQRALLALLLHAALADGEKSDAERAALRRMTEGFNDPSLNFWTVYQEVLAKKISVSDACSQLTSREARLLAYEMAVGVCDTDGPPSPAERTFLAEARRLLVLDDAATQIEREAEAATATLPDAAPVAAATIGGAMATNLGRPSQAQPALSPSQPPLLPVDVPALEKSILNQSILTGALELLPQSLATMAVVPLQMKLVYNIGKAHGYTLDRGHIRDFLATAGAGLAAQAVEGYARKLLGGFMGKALGGGMFGGLGRMATSTATGAAITFAATYAIGHLALRYYAGGRRMETAVLKDTYTKLLSEGRSLFGQHQGAIESRAANLSPSEVINLVRS
jgi:uncharacterized protein (DUF697 family)/uncharacterized tellurite resistance protein B-like protein